MTPPAHLYIGLDVGSVSAKLAMLLGPQFSDRDCAAAKARGYAALEDPRGRLLLSECRRTHGDLYHSARALLDEMTELFPGASIGGIALTGCGGVELAAKLSARYVNDFRALAEGLGSVHGDISTILEMGGDSSRYLQIETGGDGRRTRILDYSQNGDCAAGTGSFLDQQASRLKYSIEDIGEIVRSAERAATIAGRCSVFAKSDMIHAQQRGYSPDEILKGLCEAVARNFKSAIVHGRPLPPRIAFVGGVALNVGVADAMRQLLDLDSAHFFVPDYPAHYAAIGAAMLVGRTTHEKSAAVARERESEPAQRDAAPRLTMEKVTALRHLTGARESGVSEEDPEYYLGIDVGSVSTNVALLDGQRHVVKELYTATNSRPIEVVTRCLHEIADEFGDQLTIRGAGTTGSGRELIGELFGADTINDEITAHTTGANFIAEMFDLEAPDTIFEIGGQDSKFISIRDGIVIDFTMNEACAAGTGSFLEEQAEKLGLNIIDEFARVALSAQRPLRLGERCTVFMEKDVASYLRHRVAKTDIAAGLAYSVAHNYLNRVVRNRIIGDTIFFQGGTAYNDAVAAALATILQRRLIVPPYNGIIGAIGMALLAREKAERGAKTGFRGLRFRADAIQKRFFTCKGCSNFCQIQEFTIGDSVSYWGDKCSDRYRRRRKSEYEPSLPDFFEYRAQLLEQDIPGSDGTGITAGIPKAMYNYEQLPFWRTYLRELGITTVVSGNTDKKMIEDGIDYTVAEPCFPLVVAHGHIANLLARDIDYLFLPNVINVPLTEDAEENYFCPWGQTLPFVARSSPGFESFGAKILSPTVRFKEGEAAVTKALRDTSRRLGLSDRKNRAAVRAAYAAQERFVARYRDEYRSAITEFLRAGGPAVLLLGRPYNIHDAAVCLDIGRKLRTIYGIDVIPLDIVHLDEIRLEGIHPNMFWNYGQKILRAAVYTSRYDNLHAIYITNFKCGPDSYIKHYIDAALGKPYLTLQFDGHHNDAGVLTRCEAFLDSVGFLRRWRTKTAPTEVLRTERP